jgi:hypothetical protein
MKDFMILTRRTVTGMLVGTPGLIMGRGRDALAGGTGSGPERMRRYNVVWNSPSKDASGVMPVGNGDIAAGVYAIENGDLYLLLSKNDAYTYMGDIFKTGRVASPSSPIRFRPGKPFARPSIC